MRIPTTFAQGFKGPYIKPPSIITDADHVVTLNDCGAFLRFNKASAQTLTLPLDAALQIPVGVTVDFEQMGAGAVTVTAAMGVTLHASGGKVASAAQYAVGKVTKVAANEWVASGDLA